MTRTLTFDFGRKPVTTLDLDLALDRAVTEGAPAEALVEWHNHYGQRELEISWETED